MCQIRVNLRRWACLLAALACLLALLPLPAHAAGAASKVVRVGWYEDAYNITGKNGERSGYAYEYEQSVAAYTGWTYEYVKAGWSDLLQMMKSGEIDLMAGVSYTEDRAQDMLFSELPMGREIYYLYADLAHTDISASDLRTLNGKRIALLKTSVQAAQFYQWEEDHGLHLQYVWSNSFEQGKRQAQGREIDLHAAPNVFALIGQIQEETHRFAITFHHESHSRSSTRSALDGIPGVGKVRAQALLKTFKSVKAIREADIFALERVLPKDAAASVYLHFHGETDEKKDEM